MHLNKLVGTMCFVMYSIEMNVLWDMNKELAAKNAAFIAEPDKLQHRQRRQDGMTP